MTASGSIPSIDKVFSIKIMWKDRSGQNIEAGKRRKTKITFYL